MIQVSGSSADREARQTLWTGSIELPWVSATGGGAYVGCCSVFTNSLEPASPGWRGCACVSQRHSALIAERPGLDIS
jgi:hypothetical protein